MSPNVVFIDLKISAGRQFGASRTLVRSVRLAAVALHVCGDVPLIAERVLHRA